MFVRSNACVYPVEDLCLPGQTRMPGGLFMEKRQAEAVCVGGRDAFRPLKGKKKGNRNGIRLPLKKHTQKITLRLLPERKEPQLPPRQGRWQSLRMPACGCS